MNKPIYPVLRRADIPSVVAQNLDIFNEETGFMGILMPLWIDKDQVLPCLAPRLLVQSGSARRRITSTDALEASRDLDAERRLRLAELLLGLMSNTTLHAQIEAAADNAPIGPDVHSVNVLILPSMLVFCHDDPGVYIENNVELFSTAADKEATRAPLCTLLVPTPGSAHRAIEQPDEVLRDFEIYRGLSALHVDACLADLDLELAPPARQDIERIA
jgi:hypothetical protein